MGREYWGDIEGKFGFGVQSCNDIQNLINIDYEIQYRYLVCRCIKEENDLNYCKFCYDSYNDHLTAALKEEYLEEDEKTLFEEDNTIIFIINKNYQIELEKSLIKIEKLLPKSVINQFNQIKNNSDIVNGYSDIFKNVANEMNKYQNRSDLFFRYKLGLQVNYILNKQFTCSLYCEDY